MTAPTPEQTALRKAQEDALARWDAYVARREPPKPSIWQRIKGWLLRAA